MSQQMSIPTLPVQEQVAQNLDEWNAYHQRIGELVAQVTAQQKAEQSKQRAIDCVRGLFENYVTPKYPGKTFNPSAVCVPRDYCYDYQHDGVYINQIGRETWHLGDYDFFFDRHITVDDDRLLDEYKQ